MRWGSVQDKDGRGVTAVSDSNLMQMSVTQWVPFSPVASVVCLLEYPVGLAELVHHKQQQHN